MELKTTKEVAEELRVTVVTIKRMIYDGRIKAFKVGSHWRIPQEEVDRITNEFKTK